MRVRITIDTEIELPSSISDTAIDFSNQLGDPIELVLEEQRSLWWGHLLDVPLDMIQVEVVD